MQHSGARLAGPARDIDPTYCATLVDAMAAGVEVLAYGCRLSAMEIAVDHRIPFLAPGLPSC